MKTKLLILNLIVCLVALIVLSFINRSHVTEITPIEYKKRNETPTHSLYKPYRSINPNNGNNVTINQEVIEEILVEVCD